MVNDRSDQWAVAGSLWCLTWRRMKNDRFQAKERWVEDKTTVEVALVDQLQKMVLARSCKCQRLKGVGTL